MAFSLSSCMSGPSNRGRPPTRAAPLSGPAGMLEHRRIFAKPVGLGVTYAIMCQAEKGYSLWSRDHEAADSQRESHGDRPSVGPARLRGGSRRHGRRGHRSLDVAADAPRGHSGAHADSRPRLRRLSDEPAPGASPTQRSAIPSRDLCQDASNRLPKFELPRSRTPSSRARRSKGSALEITFWSHLCATAAESGSTLHDSRSDQLTSAARAARSDPAAFLGLSEVFGDLGRSEAWTEAFARQLDEVSSRGPREASHRFFDGVEA